MSLERLLKSFDDVLNRQRRYRSLLGVREVNKPTYKIQEEYGRFNHKYWVASWGRGVWDSSIREMFQQDKIDEMKRLKGAKSSYPLIGKALADASGTGARAHPHESTRWPNVGFLSWSPLITPTYKRFEMKKLDFGNPTATSNLIKKVALWFGADLVGITLLNRRWVYSNWVDTRTSPPKYPPIVFSDEAGFEKYNKPTQLKDGTQVIPKEMKYVISVASEEDYETIKTAPSYLHKSGVRRHGYGKVVIRVSALAEFIRGLGFNAIPSVNDTCLKGPIAMDAGLGEDSRIGLIITPEYGPRVRLGAVITDLPMTSDNPITFGIHKFCEECKRCAQACPVQAISSETRTYGIEKNDVDAPTISTMPGTLRWVANQERCSSFMSGGCGVCRRVCPWNKAAGIFHTISKWLAIKGTPFTTRMLVKMDEIFGYGKRIKPEKWWTTAKTGHYT